MKNLTNNEIIHDLEAIKSSFMEQTNGCYPISLEAAINIIQNIDHIQTELDRAKSFLKESKEEWLGLWSEPTDDCSVYGEKLYAGDTIYLLGIKGTVMQNDGAWGWGSSEYVPWEDLEKKIPHNNKPDFCYCDNFISFFELKWNFDDGDDWDGVPFIRKEAKNE